ncbi:MAG TPA: metal-dependent hydrolase [Gemmata sp.]|nr:metal-dependent hydrolase [Gemmata sp.]
MAGFRTHITVSGALGVAYGGAAVQPMGFGTDAAVLAAGLTFAGGMLPDLDSDSGTPVREMFGLAAAVVPLLLIPRMAHADMTREAILASVLFGYIIIKYVIANVFRRLTVHRGMYHSIPAMLIAGLVVYLAYHSPDRSIRLLLAGGVMLGFASHLVLDEIYSVDLRGVKIKLKSSAGTAVKFGSSSLIATATCYLILGSLAYLAYLDYNKPIPPDTAQTRKQRGLM